MLMKRYTAVTDIMARGAASLMVRTGSRTSESTELMLAYPMKDLEEVISRKYMQKVLIQMTHHMTLYKPLTKAPDPVPDPSQNLSHVKLLGFSYSSLTWMPFTPARYKKPDTGIRASTRSFKAPRVFCTRRPSFKRVPWTRHIEVRQVKATSRVLSHVGSIYREWSRSRIKINSQRRSKRLRCVHSLKTTLFGVEFPCQRWMNIAVKSIYI
jgi:hypothetical protein